METDDSMHKDVYLGRAGSIFDNLLPPSPFNPVSLWNLPEVYNFGFGGSSCALL